LTDQELELWTLDVISAIQNNQPVEDSRIELKSEWPEPKRAAPRLAAHANAARGTPVLWLVGIDEKARRIVGAHPSELANWFPSVAQFFDGDPPRMVLHVNVRSGGNTIVALYFETHQGSPFVVKNIEGGYPQFVVPWREGARTRAANRYELLRILVPIRRFSVLIDELNHNLEVARAGKTRDHLGALFREDAFNQVLDDAAMSALPESVKKAVTDAYISMNRANNLIKAYVDVPLQHKQPLQGDTACNAVRDCVQIISHAVTLLSS
jgi:hypothetical protein